MAPYTSFLIKDEIERITGQRIPLDKFESSFEQEKAGDIAFSRSKILSEMKRKQTDSNAVFMPSLPYENEEINKDIEKVVNNMIVSGEKTFIIDRSGYYVDTGYDKRTGI